MTDTMTDTMLDPTNAAPPQAAVLDEDEAWQEPGPDELLDEDEAEFLAELWADDELLNLLFSPEFHFELPPDLLPDPDPERALARQKELMDTVFGGVGVETKPEKRLGMAMQQFDIEQRHALRLLLLFDDPAALTQHLQRCLAEPKYGYGERGWNGRTIAQALAAITPDGDLSQIAGEWWASYHDFREQVMSGTPFSFLSMFETGDSDLFTPIVQRVTLPADGPETWRLGVPGEGQHRDFQGDIEKIWPRLADTYAEWSEQDNEQWLQQLKKKATRQTPDSIFRVARADRLRREHDQLTVGKATVSLATVKEAEPWPRAVVMTAADGQPLLALSRLSGHNFYELTWNGGLNTRRFELSGTTRNRVPFEHIELALWLAETMGLEQGLQPAEVTPEEVEAAYLRRMKATQAKMGPPALTAAELPKVVKARPVASYQVHQITATLLADSALDVAWISQGDRALLLQQDAKRGVLLALPTERGRPRRGQPLMTTPLAELDWQNGAAKRALLAWGSWLLWVTDPARKAKAAVDDGDGDE